LPPAPSQASSQQTNTRSATPQSFFDLVLLEYPYGVAFENSEVFDHLQEICLTPAQMIRPVPFVRVDWFVSTVTQSPLYEDLLQLPAGAEFIVLASAPTGVSATTDNSRMMTLKWNAVPNATDYEVLVHRVSFEVFHPSVATPLHQEPTVDATPILTWTTAAGASSYDLTVSRTGFNTPSYRVSQLVGISHRIAVPLSSGMHQVWVRALRDEASSIYASAWSNLLEFELI
jgi:hypothetical protein